MEILGVFAIILVLLALFVAVEVGEYRSTGICGPLIKTLGVCTRDADPAGGWEGADWEVATAVRFTSWTAGDTKLAFGK